MGKYKIKITMELVSSRDKPKTPIKLQLSSGGVLYQCADCDNSIFEFQNFCPACGQKILWEEERNV